MFALLVAILLAGSLSGWQSAYSSINTVTVDCTGATLHEHVDAVPADISNRRGMRVIDDSLGHQGLKTGSAGTDTCWHVGSFGVVFNSSNQVELGWERSNSSVTCVAADNKYRRLSAYKAAGQFVCLESNPPQLTAQTYYTGTVVRDGSTPGVWQYWWNGSNFAAVNFLTTYVGLPSTNAERVNLSDPEHAKFDGNQYQSSTGWHHWSIAGSPAVCAMDNSYDFDSTGLTDPDSFEVNNTGSNFLCP